METSPERLRELLEAANEQIRILMSVMDFYHDAVTFSRPHIPVEMLPDQDLWVLRAQIIRVGTSWPSQKQVLKTLRKQIKRALRDTE